MPKSKGRKDFEKKRRVRQNNWPQYKRVLTRGGLRAGDGYLPESKKITLSKLERNNNKKDADNSTKA